MVIAHKADSRHGNFSHQQRTAILEELDRLLDDPLFKHSKRCVLLLRWLVENALKQNLAGLKERTLGIEVFRRPADYDTNVDPVVRMTANEIRKRMAQYDQKNDTARTVKIYLIPGCYIPEFLFVDCAGPTNAAARPEPGMVPQENSEPALHAFLPESAAPVARRFAIWTFLRFFRGVRLPIAGVLVALLLLCLYKFYWRPDPLDLLWAPALHTKATPILCVSDDPTFLLTMKQNSEQGLQLARALVAHASPGVSDPDSYKHSTSFGDLNVANQIAIWFASRHVPSIARPTSELTFAEFREKPVVLVGSINNPWTLILLSHLRFTPHIDSSVHTTWIQDSFKPDDRKWSRPYALNGEPLEDYAIISRFWNQETSGWIYGIAGLGVRGTEAAGKWLTTANPIPALPASIKSDNNFQIVLKISVINGRAASSQIVAFYSW